MKSFLNVIIILFVVIVSVLVISLGYRLFTSKSSIDKSEQSGNILSNNKSIQIEVLNSTNQKGLASGITKYFRENKFDVIKIGNYPELLNKSIVIDRVGNRTSALRVAKVTGISDSSIVTRIDSSLFLDCSIVLGSDYKKLTPFRQK